MLQQDMVANRIDEWSKSIRLPQATFAAQQCQYPHEGFLPDIFHGFFGFNRERSLRRISSLK